MFAFGATLALTTLLSANAFATEMGEEGKGPLPSDCAIHLVRSEAMPDEPWRHQIFQNAINLEPGGDYTLTFWAKASGEFKLAVSTKVSAPPWNYFGVRDDAQLTTKWRRYQFRFSAEGAVEGQSRVTFSYKAPEPGEIWITGVQVLPTGVKAGEQENLVANGNFADGMMHWYLGGKQTGVFDAMMEMIPEGEPPATP